jgi:hypothetical protein
LSDPKVFDIVAGLSRSEQRQGQNRVRRLDSLLSGKLSERFIIHIAEIKKRGIFEDAPSYPTVPSTEYGVESWNSGRVDGFEISRWFSFAMVRAIMSATPDPVDFNPSITLPKEITRTSK